MTKPNHRIVYMALLGLVMQVSAQSMKVFTKSGGSATYDLNSIDSITFEPYHPTNLILMSPTGGETFKVGDTLNVRWSERGANAGDINVVDIRLSPDEGRTWIYLNVGSIAKGSAQWESF